MRITVRLLSSSFELDIDENALVPEFRQICAEKMNESPSNVVLIFKGKLMNDTDTFKNLDIRDGCSVHCVSKNTPKQKESPTTQSQPKPKPTPVTQPAPAQPSNPVSVDTANPFAALQSALPADPASYSSMVRSFTENADLSRIVNNPNFLELLAAIDPRIKTLLETNPECASLLRDPAVIRQMFDIAQNPQAMQEMMQSQERLMAQLQNVPGGMNQLLRSVANLNRVSSGHNSQTPAPTTAAGQSNSSTANVSGEAMPNPWASTSTTPAPSHTSSFTQPPRRSGVVESDNLYRDLIESLRLGPPNESPQIAPFLERIRANLATLSVRGQYGVAEFAKGLEIIREESPDLLISMINYQMSTIKLGFTAAESQLAGSASGGLPGTPASLDEAIPPDTGNEQTYASQLSELNNMGFSNVQENLDALRFSYGDVNGAVEWILRRRGIQ